MSAREYNWHASTELALNTLIELGERELPKYPEPRIEQRARKRR
jgi:hypothetical protein